ncbi:hypothetical protein MBRA1_001328 [Malassezia brasiliensis]|uniref:HMG box domain-containing protein n=1 Tax=Malassezia brasiliensis TaxID=1821822 RepID=A0AAF0IN40_9BASI|nr:hypothetical protein MBRA1_001328 [Malassezia brasiliensis]
MSLWKNDLGSTTDIASNTSQLPFAASPTAPFVTSSAVGGALPLPVQDAPDSWPIGQDLFLPAPCGAGPQPIQVGQDAPPPAVQDLSCPSTPRSTSHTRKMAPGHIKRPRNAFILFRSHAVATNLVPKEVERDHRNISRIISHMWRSLGKEERAMWEAQAQVEKERHRREHPDYKYRPGSRRTNISRRNVRKLSSTERECEHIADVILKACGRSGVKRRRSSTGQIRRLQPSDLTVGPDPLIPRRPSLRRSISSNGLVLPPTPSNRQAAQEARYDASSFLQPDTFDVRPGKMLRRSSSAPPAESTGLQLAHDAEVGQGFTLGEGHMAGDALDWVLDTPLVSQPSSPYALDPSALVNSPFQGLPPQPSVPPQDEPATQPSIEVESACMEQTFEAFSLDAGPTASHDTELFGLRDMVPSCLLPPVSPTSTHPSSWSVQEQAPVSVQSMLQHQLATTMPSYCQVPSSTPHPPHDDLAHLSDGAQPWDCRKMDMPLLGLATPDCWRPSSSA